MAGRWVAKPKTKLSKSEPELGTAQPHIVLYECCDDINQSGLFKSNGALQSII